MTTRVCATPGCPTLTSTAYHCPTHTRDLDKARGTRQQRGYDATHDATRRQLLPTAYGTRCPHCGHYMYPHDQLHLDHTDDRTAYIGIVHEPCNLSRAGCRPVNKPVDK